MHDSGGWHTSVLRAKQHPIGVLGAEADRQQQGGSQYGPGEELRPARGPSFVKGIRYRVHMGVWVYHRVMRRKRGFVTRYLVRHARPLRTKGSWRPDARVASYSQPVSLNLSTAVEHEQTKETQDLISKRAASWTSFKDDRLGEPRPFQAGDGLWWGRVDPRGFPGRRTSFLCRYHNVILDLGVPLRALGQELPVHDHLLGGGGL